MAKSNKERKDENKGSVAEPLVNEGVEESDIKISLAQAIRYAPYERGLKEMLVSKYGTQEHTEDKWAEIIAEEITRR